VSKIDERFSLAGKVAVVTGAGGRGNSIGRAYAMGLASAGAAVVAADLNDEGAKQVAAEIVADGGKAVGVKVDITDRASVRPRTPSAASTSWSTTPR
jgi:NAD(P)-dependent dehydrogenase (short-subunit alcohol dehydrogenase family)